MKLNFVFFLSIIVVGYSACSQKFNIVKAHAFTRSSIPGTVQVDEYNRERNPGSKAVHLIFVETKANQPAPVWDTAWINGQAYLVKPIEITQPELRLGKTRDTDQEVVLTTKPGNKLWQLMITSERPVATKPAGDITPGKAVTLTGKWKQKTFVYPIAKEQPLETQFNQ
jgi:hypothetical protein